MSDGDDDVTELSPESFDERLTETGEALDTAEAEADLDEVEVTLDDIEADVEAVNLPEPDDEDEDNPAKGLESRLSDLCNDFESQRGPYTDGAVETLEEAKSTIMDTRWTERGDDGIAAVVETFADEFNGVLDASVSIDGDDGDALTVTVDDAVSTIETADLDADDDAETVADLIEVTDSLADDLNDAQKWDDLEIREKFQVQGFYGVLDHYKDFPPELSALKEHEKRGNVKMITLAFENLQPNFMQEYYVKAFTQVSDDRAYEATGGQAKRHDKGIIKAVGRMAAEEDVEMFVDYVDTDSDPVLQKVVLKALGRIGPEEATRLIANKFVTESDSVRSTATRILDLIGDTRAVESLSGVVANDDEDAVRASAARALRQTGTNDALEVTVGYTDDRSLLVRHGVGLAAEFLGDDVEAEVTVWNRTTDAATRRLCDPLSFSFSHSRS